MTIMAEGGKWLGPAWWILQILRVCNIIALLSIAASSIVMVVKTNIVNDFFFFQAVSHFVTCGVALVLIASELPQFGFVRDFYRRSWPAFSTVDACNRGHSLAWLGAWMCGLGVWTLGSLNTAGLIAKLSLPLWRLTLASGILAVVFGTFNVVVSVLFRNGARGITVRMIREHGANVYNARVASMPPEWVLDASSLDNGSSRSDSVRKEKRGIVVHHTHRLTQNFAQGFTQNRLTRLFARDKKPQISGPIAIHPQDRDVEAQHAHDHHDHHSDNEHVVVNPGSPEAAGRESWEGFDRASPIAPNVQVSDRSPRGRDY